MTLVYTLLGYSIAVPLWWLLLPIAVLANVTGYQLGRAVIDHLLPPS